MARDITVKDVRPLLDSLSEMLTAANFGAGASVLTVNQLRDLVDVFQLKYNVARTAWDSLVSETGSAANAEAVLADYITPTPTNVLSALGSINTGITNFLNDYEGSVYGTGSAAHTYSVSQVSNLWVGGHSEVNITAGVLSVVNSRCSTLVADLTVIAPE